MLLHCFLVGSLIVGSLLGLLLELLLPLATVVLIAYVLYYGFSLLAVFDLSEVYNRIRRLSQKILMMGNKYYGLGARLNHLLEPVQGLQIQII